jgi:hypothetical protein
VGTAANDFGFGYDIELSGGHTGLDGLAHFGQGGSCDFTGLAHANDFGVGFDCVGRTRQVCRT